MIFFNFRREKYIRQQLIFVDGIADEMNKFGQHLKKADLARVAYDKKRFERELKEKGRDRKGRESVRMSVRISWKKVKII